MSHSKLELQVDAYLDGELASRDARDFKAHLKECPDCARLHDARVALGAAIRAEVPALRAPDELRTRVRAALRSAAGPSVTRHTTAPLGRRWLALAASVVLVAVGSWRLASNRAAGEALSEQVLTSHVRSLMPGHLTDVVSSDQHTVKPWFNGKLDFSPAVYDFAGRGYPLIGGRLDYLGGRPVAALVYGRRQHLINVFLWPATQGPGREPGETMRQGYHLLHWTTPEYTYWVVSDLGMAELREFAQLVRGADSAATR
ncbi:MAG TPA: anti-sigma factor [Gemmatimonadales bacterium]|nr:anti-sigma factor [Gemmatimonadales bacterium]